MTTPRPPLLEPFDANASDEATWNELCARIILRARFDRFWYQGQKVTYPPAKAWLDYRQKVELDTLRSLLQNLGFRSERPPVRSTRTAVFSDFRVR